LLAEIVAPPERRVPRRRRAGKTTRVPAALLDAGLARDKQVLVLEPRHIAARRIQEIFGLAATPRLARGRVRLVLELLGPNHRPAQSTDDLESFWRRTYPDVRKQLRGATPSTIGPKTR